MDYETKKVRHKIVHIPDKELEIALDFRLKRLKEYHRFLVSNISTFRKKNGFRNLLARHLSDRFFVIIDFVHAFHQITRQMVAEVFPIVLDKHFDVCFVQMGGKEVVPIGFSTSNYIFEIFTSQKLDQQFMLWQSEHNGNVTRHSDNVLVTWPKSTLTVFYELEKIFEGLNVRFTPKVPRRWREPIRFCGLIITRKGKVHLSRRKIKEIMATARGKSFTATNGAREFINRWY